jgi:hypothetical protein
VSFSHRESFQIFWPSLATAFLKCLRDTRGDTIEALTHIHGFDGQEDFHLTGDAQYGRRSSISRTVSRVSRSKPGRTRNRRPRGNDFNAGGWRRQLRSNDFERHKPAPLRGSSRLRA